MTCAERKDLYKGNESGLSLLSEDLPPTSCYQWNNQIEMKHSDIAAFRTKNPFNPLGAGFSTYIWLYITHNYYR